MGKKNNTSELKTAAANIETGIAGLKQEAYIFRIDNKGLVDILQEKSWHLFDRIREIENDKVDRKDS
jgi:hypothetical protein